MRLQTLGNMDIQWENHLRQVRGTHENRRGRVMCGAISTICLTADCSNWVRYEAICDKCKEEE